VAGADPLASPSLTDASIAPRTARTVVPEGTIPVAVGLVISGLSAYGFLSLTAHGLGTDAAKPVNQLWFATFILAPGFFLPVEQEVGRALAHRRALGQGGLPVLRKAALLGAGLLGIVIALLLAMSAFLISEVFDGSWPLFACLLLAFCSYAVGHFLRGSLAGTGRFQQYGLFMASDGLIRVVSCALLVAAGVTLAGAYGLLVGIPPLIAVFIALRGNFHLTPEGPPAEWSELTPNLGWLVAGSVAAAGLLNAGPIAANLLAGPGQDALVSEFSYAVLVARVPLFMFQAVQAALLPKLARLAARGQIVDFKIGFRRLMRAVGVVGVVGVVAAATIGPFMLDILFNAEVGRRTLTLLALGSAMFMVALGTAQAVIALHGHAWVAGGWITGLLSFVLVTAVVSDDLLFRVELGLVAGSAVAMCVFAYVLRLKLHSGVQVDTSSFLDAITEHPLETP
jgi:O-antigen/teichoic acid export membrane protein